MVNKKRDPDNIFHYFRATFGRWPPDDTLRELQNDTELGRKCVAVINAAEPLWQHARRAQKDQERHLQDEVVRVTYSIIAAIVAPSWNR
jgi:hypothetical protein